MPAHPQAGFSNGISDSYPAHFIFVTAQEYNEQCIADLKGIDLILLSLIRDWQDYCLTHSSEVI